MPAEPPRHGLLTVGHGTLSAQGLAGLLWASGVEQLVDVRSYPGSRRHPQFGREQMEAWLPESGVAYRWERRLGGRRPVRAGSVNVALRNEAFRGYADHPLQAPRPSRSGGSVPPGSSGGRRRPARLWRSCCEHPADQALRVASRRSGGSVGGG